MDELHQDAQDAYNRWVKYISLPALLVYGVATLVSRHSEEALDNGQYRYAARDTGLLMTTVDRFPRSLLATHMSCGVALCTLVMLQKFVVEKMSTNYKYYRDIHGAVGFFILLLSLCMSVAGFLLGFHSALPNFLGFSILFAFPWVFWSLTVWWSASFAHMRLHRLLGNMMVKGCIAVPMSRVVGAALQTRGWSEAAGYYQGIIFASVVVGMWQVLDCIFFLRNAPSAKKKVDNN